LGNIFLGKCKLDQHLNDILNVFFNQPTAEERRYECFQPDNATAHTAEKSIAAVCEQNNQQRTLT
jgi:hypothetical protein